MKRNIQKSIAQAMVDDFCAAAQKHDQSRAWKPVRASVKRHATASSPTIGGKTLTEEIADFLRIHCQKRMAPTVNFFTNQVFREHFMIFV